MIIYKATNLINNKIYIGLTTKSLDDRIKGHKQSMKNCNYAFYRAMRKYGFENFVFEQIDSAETLDDLINMEFKYIKEYNSMDPKIGYNMIAQNDSLKYFSDEVREKIGLANKTKYRGKTPEEKLAISFNLTYALQGRRYKKGTSEYIGVRKMKHGSYCFTISYRGKTYAKNFKNEIECAKCYDIFALYLFGENAKINFEENRQYYLGLDLEEIVDKVLNTHSFGRKGKKGYDFYDLPALTKPTAISNLTAFLKNKEISDDISEFIINITFHWNGEIFLNNTKYSTIEEFAK